MRLNGYKTAALLGLCTALAALGCGSHDQAADPPKTQIPPHQADADREHDDRSDVPTSASSGADLNHPLVILMTSHGKIIIRLDADTAPGTVRNFLNYANAGLYDQTVFHYVEPGSMIVGGGFTKDLKLKTNYGPIRNEAHNGVKNRRGTIAMSRQYDAMDSATSQFFINLADNTSLDFRDRTPEGYGYCVFGEIIEGLELADQIANVETHDVGEFSSIPIKPVVIKSVRFAP